ncbi:hypothetical protein E2C01_032138 [Portunus trituberculatus]|uniref:Uncharacterized protein n=1 Tax=Portunus trituberculatus TaxID=210409 RepID=A0A5B7F065_PORTR|nr:hypothetical protein [Portunus trituberculatus]
MLERKFEAEDSLQFIVAVDEAAVHGHESQGVCVAGAGHNLIFIRARQISLTHLFLIGVRTQINTLRGLRGEGHSQRCQHRHHVT